MMHGPPQDPARNPQRALQFTPGTGAGARGRRNATLCHTRIVQAHVLSSDPAPSSPADRTPDPSPHPNVQRTARSAIQTPAKPGPGLSHKNGTEKIAEAGPFPYSFSMAETLIGYARCSTDSQDLAAQRQALQELGVAEERIYTDHGLTGTTRDRPGLDQALAAVREGDTLVVSKLDRLARSVSDARAIADRLRERGVKLALGRALYDPGDPMGKMFFNILATFAEFEADLIRMRTREGMAIARARGKLRGKQPKLSDKQQRELCRMHATGEYSISDLAELFSVSRPTVYRTLNRCRTP